ncbi:MAG: prefoldin subunit alpha [Thermoplasmatales archaeon]
MSQDSRINEIAYGMEVIREQMEEIEERNKSLTQLLQDLLVTSEFLKNIQMVEGNSMIPIGRGLYVEAEIKDKERVLVSLGSNAYKKAKIDDALKIIEERRKDVTNAIEKNNNLQDDLQTRYAQLEQYLNNLYKK